MFFVYFCIMAIGKTRLDEFLKRGKLLKELDMWYKSFNEATKEQMISWLQSQLTDKGTDGRGVIIGNYSYATELISKGRKQQGDHFTLNDTGNFYRSMQVYIGDSLFEINGDGKKEEDNLYKKYGEYITTLDQENIERLRQLIRPKFIEYVRKILLIN